jgi:predicted nucleotide-binding protein (sugar kinase/HSP70/actin superfamily)
MATATVQPYRAYSPRPFTRAERDSTTIVYGGLHWRVERVFQAVMENMGYHARPLPIATREDLLVGRELADLGQCCPTSFTAGNLVNFLKSELARLGSTDEVSKRYVYVTAGACGACRFGQYHQSYSLALQNVGFDAFRMFLIAQDQMDQGAAEGNGLELNMPFTLGMVWALLCTDVLQDLEYQVRPYELVPGQTDAVAKESVEELYQAFRNRPVKGKKWGVLGWHLATSYFADALRRVRKKFDAIEVDRLRVKPMVKITGEFYLQTVEGEANYNIHRWLESEGAEVQPAVLAIWLDYLIRLGHEQLGEYVGLKPRVRLKQRALRAGQTLYRWTYDRMRHALGDIPHELPDQYELQELAAPYFNWGLTAGEGDMLVGKALWAYKHHRAHMICELSPYACLPNTMSVGAMAYVLGRYPDLLYAPIEIKGDAEVHALSRCQMILTEAKKRAQREFDDALELSGITVAQAREYLAAHPEMRRASYRIPHAGVAGTAANTVLHVAKMRARA